MSLFKGDEYEEAMVCLDEIQNTFDHAGTAAVVFEFDDDPDDYVLGKLLAGLLDSGVLSGFRYGYSFLVTTQMPERN